MSESRSFSPSFGVCHQNHQTKRKRKEKKGPPRALLKDDFCEVVLTLVSFFFLPGFHPSLPPFQFIGGFVLLTGIFGRDLVVAFPHPSTFCLLACRIGHILFPNGFLASLYRERHATSVSSIHIHVYVHVLIMIGYQLTILTYTIYAIP